MGQIESAGAGASGGAAPSASRLRADARRNSEQIRAAAIGAFQGRGLTVPLEDVAKAAGVSKATIFNRFGGRIGLIEAVIEEVVATELFAVIDRARTIADAGERTAYYLTALRDLQYRQPAVNDVLLQTYPHSQQLMEICRAGSEANTEIVAAARAGGAVRPEFTAGDLHALVVDTALALKHGQRPPRDEYDRRTTYLLDGIRGPRPTLG
ncbi:TetR/AcrR family transcriptional regulator [Streptomyces paromomycinus]|uniref:SriL03.11 n=1 Tax=Streptomyces paromomycinus TaxID=92743 RepID=Q2MFL9_STREY|nr:TetR/AcrR family transcriptional regulator [Streptomyces paromomycinus]GCD40695.1 TetR family transcriptional regulator [Streptomyces paromomycinus]CAG44630.1 SriL03.11 [Streptomyces paromomycinus]